MADKKSSETADLDLFGNPVSAIRDHWGRPEFEVTEENQRLVAVLKAKGWSQKRIAAYLGCDEKTLRKHFSRELQAGSDMVEADALAVLLAKMRQGNMVAVKRILEICDDGRAAPPEQVLASLHGETGVSQDDETEAEAKLGKKERLALEAKRPKGAWAATLRKH